MAGADRLTRQLLLPTAAAPRPARRRKESEVLILGQRLPEVACPKRRQRSRRQAGSGASRCLGRQASPRRRQPALRGGRWAGAKAWSDKYSGAVVKPLQPLPLARCHGDAGGAECVVWLATRERPRPREAFMRSIRATLKKLNIDPSRLRRGTWLVLESDDVVFRESRATRATCSVAGGQSTAGGIAQQVPLLSKPSNKALAFPQALQEDGDEKIIHLTGSARRASCSS